MNKKPNNNQEIIRNQKGQFMQGCSGNPQGVGAGRPKGALSLIGLLKEKLEEIPQGEQKNYAELIIEKMIKKAMAGEDSQIKNILQYTEGLPRQLTIMQTSAQQLKVAKVSFYQARDENGNPIDDEKNTPPPYEIQQVLNNIQQNKNSL